MGGSKKYNPDGGFTEQGYKQTGITANNIKIISIKGTGKSSTPAFSNTPNTMYAKTKDKTGVVTQISFYSRGKEQRGKTKDIDIDHKHKNKDNKLKFSENDIHVHEYDENGRRSENARKPSKKERRLLMVARYRKRVK